MLKKIYIVGPVGSGKSTLARKISREFGHTCCEMDSVIYEPYAASSSGNRKRAEADRDALIGEILSAPSWVMEDAGRPTFEYLWEAADAIIFLDFPVSVRKRRIVLRWIKQRLGLERCGYKPDWVMLKLMFKWTQNFEDGIDTLKARLVRFGDKVIRLHTNHDVKRYIDEHISANDWRR